jgi:pimeloyl-ACP methyl ester carboxylesterase
MLGRNVRLGRDEQEWADLVALIWVKNMRVNAIYPSVFATTELRAIRRPTLLLIGDNELLYDPREIVKRARKRMPSLEAQIVPGAYHIAAMAKPDDVNARILAFLTAA